MEYKRIENKIVFRLEMGEGLMESTQRIATAENVKLASINGIGGAVGWRVMVCAITKSS